MKIHSLKTKALIMLGAVMLVATSMAGVVFYSLQHAVENADAIIVWAIIAWLVMMLVAFIGFYLFLDRGYQPAEKNC